MYNMPQGIVQCDRIRAAVFLFTYTFFIYSRPEKMLLTKDTVEVHIDFVCMYDTQSAVRAEMKNIVSSSCNSFNKRKTENRIPFCRRLSYKSVNICTYVAPSLNKQPSIIHKRTLCVNKFTAQNKKHQLRCITHRFHKQ